MAYCQTYKLPVPTLFRTPFDSEEKMPIKQRIEKILKMILVLIRKELAFSDVIEVFPIIKANTIATRLMPRVLPKVLEVFARDAATA